MIVITIEDTEVVTKVTTKMIAQGYGGDNNNRQQPGRVQRGTGKGPFVYTGKEGQLNKYLGKDAMISRMGDNVPTDLDCNKLCFNGFTYKKCAFQGRTLTKSTPG